MTAPWPSQRSLVSQSGLPWMKVSKAICSVFETAYVPGGRYTTAGCETSVAMMSRPCDSARLMAAVSSVTPSPLAPNSFALRKVVALCSFVSSSHVPHPGGGGGTGTGAGGGGGGGLPGMTATEPFFGTSVSAAL